MCGADMSDAMLVYHVLAKKKECDERRGKGKYAARLRETTMQPQWNGGKAAPGNVFPLKAAQGRRRATISCG